MSLYIPDLSTDEFGHFVQGLADNFSLLEDSLVEYGSNENGEYWRWENGLLICYRFVGDYFFEEEHGTLLAPNSQITLNSFDVPALPLSSTLRIEIVSGGLYSAGGSYRAGMVYTNNYWTTGAWDRLIAINWSDTNVAIIVGLRMMLIGRWK